MRMSHEPLKISARFDDPNLVSPAGLVPVVSRAERAGVAALVRRHVRLAAKTGVNAEVKAGCLVAGMAARADSIDDLEVLRHDGMAGLSDGVREPATPFLRSFIWATCASWRKRMYKSTRCKRVYRHEKQAAGFGHAKIQSRLPVPTRPSECRSWLPACSAPNQHRLALMGRPGAGR